MTAPTPPASSAKGGPPRSSTDDEPSDPSTKGERTRQRLLEIAVDQFGNRGLRATSVTDITREAGLTQAACYAYFDNKAALFREAVDTDVAELIESVRAPIADTPVDQLLTSMLLHLAAELDRHPLATRVLGGQEPEGVQALGQLPAVLAVRNLLAQRLMESQAAGEVRSDVDPDRLAAGIQVVLLALLTTMTVSRGAQDATEGGADLLVDQPDVVAGIVEVLDALLRTPNATPS